MRKYTKAPISELIFGVIFNSSVLLKSRILFTLIEELSKEYPIIQTHPAILEEDWIDNNLSVNVDYGKSGFSLYRLYSADGYYLVQIQQNCILLNWVKKDEIAVGKYPGFTVLFSKFKNIIESVILKFKDHEDLKDLDFKKQIKSYSLTYLDRVRMDSNNNSCLKILNLKLPKITNEENDVNPETILSKFVMPCPQINGHNSLTINTANDTHNNRILIVENRIKGNNSLDTIDEWFIAAHKIQVDLFENLFTKEILSSWK
ncbi:MAG: TIGR04255 family protein [Bacteroidia bacterium]